MSTPNSTPESAPALLTLRQLAKAISVDPGQLSKESRRPGFPAHQAEGGGILYVASEVAAYRHANVRQKKPRTDPDPAPADPTPRISPPAPPMPAAGVDRPAPSPAMPPIDTPPPQPRPRPTPPIPPVFDRGEDADLLTTLKSADTSAIQKSRALVTLVSRRLANQYERSDISPNDIDGLKKSLQELRGAEANYIALEAEQRRLIPRDQVKQLVAECASRLITVLDQVENRIATEFSVWLTDPMLAAMEASERARMIQTFVSDTTRNARIEQADEIDRLIDQPRA